MSSGTPEFLEVLLQEYQARTFQYGATVKTIEKDLQAWGKMDTKVIELSKALLRAFTPAEVAAVLAHEIGHIALGASHRSKWSEKWPTLQMWTWFAAGIFLIWLLWELTSWLFLLISDSLILLCWPILLGIIFFLLLLKADWQRLADEYAADLLAIMLLNDPCFILHRNFL